MKPTKLRDINKLWKEIKEEDISPKIIKQLRAKWFRHVWGSGKPSN